MPVRVGTDLVAVDDVRAALVDHGDRYLERVYTKDELADCRDASGLDPERLASRFAGKEAVMKLLREGEMAWRSIEVVKHDQGWVAVSLEGRAAMLAREAGIEEIALSLTHEAGFAAAVAVAEVAR